MDSRDISQFSCKAEAFEASEDIGRNPTEGPTMGDIINKRFGRRDMLRGSLAAAAITATFGPLALATAEKAKAAAGNGMKASFSFDEVERGVDRTHHVAKGYKADILIRWGDPVLPGAPAFDPMKQTAAAQKMQFGYNNDFVGYIGLPYGSNNPDHGLLCINHEYTDEEVMFPGVGVAQDGKDKEGKDIGFVGHDQGSGRYRDGGPWRHRDRGQEDRRQMGRGARQQVQPPDHRVRHGDGDHRPGRRS